MESEETALISSELTVKLTPEEMAVLENYRLQTGAAYPHKKPVGDIQGNITYRQDAFAREVAKLTSEEITVKQLAKCYRRVHATKKPWDRVNVLMQDPKVLDRIQVYRKVYATNRDTLLAEREQLTQKIQDSWEDKEVIETGEKTCTPRVKTADLLAAFKDRELAYVGEPKKDDGGKTPGQVIININGDARATVEKAKMVIEAEVINETTKES